MPACDAAGVTLGVVLQHRFKPAAERLAAILRTGALGQIVNCSTSIRLWRPQSYYDEPGRGTKARDGGGVLMTQGIHTLDLMLSLAGPIVEVGGYARTSPVHRMETEDLVCAAVRFASGAVGVIDATTAAYPGGPERIELIGTMGTASLAGTALTVRFHDGRQRGAGGGRLARRHGRRPDGLPARLSLGRVARFPRCDRAEKAPRVSGAEALKVHRLIDASAGGRRCRPRQSRSDNHAAAHRLYFSLASSWRWGWQGCASISQRVKRLSERGDAALFDGRARARVDDVPGVRQIHVFLAEVEAHGPGPRVVGGLLGAVHGEVLVAHGAPDIAAADAAALVVAVAPHIAVDARGIAMMPRVLSLPIALAVAATVDAHVAGRSVIIVADHAIGPIPMILTLRLCRHQDRGGGEKQN